MGAHLFYEPRKSHRINPSKMVGMGWGVIKAWHKNISITRKSYKNMESYTLESLMLHGPQMCDTPQAVLV